MDNYEEQTQKSCIIKNEEVTEILRNALYEYFTSLSDERLLEIESYMSCD